MAAFESFISKILFFRVAYCPIIVTGIGSVMVRPGEMSLVKLSYGSYVLLRLVWSVGVQLRRGLFCNGEVGSG